MSFTTSPFHALSEIDVLNKMTNAHQGHSTDNEVGFTVAHDDAANDLSLSFEPGLAVPYTHTPVWTMLLRVVAVLITLR